MRGIALPTMARIAHCAFAFDFITPHSIYWLEYVQADPHMMVTVATVMHSNDSDMSAAARLPEHQAAKQTNQSINSHKLTTHVRSNKFNNLINKAHEIISAQLVVLVASA